MGWVYIDDNYHENSKIVRAGGDAELLWLHMACRVARERTHGRVPAAWVNKYSPRRGRHLADRLVAVSLWNQIYGGYQFVDVPFLKIKQRPFRRWRTPEPIRRRIIERDGKCQRCGTTDKLTVDHKYPVSLGGTDDEDNLQALCGRCNSKKGARVEWSG